MTALYLKPMVLQINYVDDLHGPMITSSKRKTPMLSSSILIVVYVLP